MDETIQTGPVRVELLGAVVVVTLDHPPSRNALSEHMLSALLKAIDKAGSDPSIKAIVLTALGPVFSAGHDLKQLTVHRADTDGGRSYFSFVMTRCAELMQAIVRCPRPVIASGAERMPVRAASFNGVAPFESA